MPTKSKLLNAIKNDWQHCSSLQSSVIWLQEVVSVGTAVVPHPRPPAKVRFLNPASVIPLRLDLHLTAPEGPNQSALWIRTELPFILNGTPQASQLAACLRVPQANHHAISCGCY